MSRFDNLVASRFEQAEKEGRLNRHNSGEVEEFYNWLRERSRQSYGGRSDYGTISAEIEDAIDFHYASLNLDKGFKEQGHFARRTMHGIRRSVEKADKSYESVWDFGSKVVRLGIVVAGLAAVILVSYWFFWSNEASLPKLQRAALENTACRPLSKDQCDYLVSAIERTKSSLAITAANGGDLKPAEEAIQANARKVDANPDTSSETKAQAAADSAIISLAISRLEIQMKRTADGVEKLGNTLKKETSDNPRKELQNLGIPWTSDEYAGVITRCDMLGIRLFRESGMKMPVQHAQLILEGTKNVSCLELVRDELATFKEEACFKPRLSIPFTFAYEKPDHRAFIESFCGEARLREKYPILYGGKQAGPPTGLAAELAAKAPLVLSDEQAKAERERLKTLFPGASNMQPAPQATTTPSGNGPLNSDEIRKTVVSRNVDHADGFRFWYKPDGSFEQFSGRVSSQGGYRIEADGRICWVDEFKLSGCFQYYRKDGGIYVRGNESNRRTEIGIVKITAR